jgi:hypothetical protein
MKKLVALILVSFCFCQFTYCLEETTKQDNYTEIHETWRVKFNCDSACNTNCGLDLIENEDESYKLVCSCEGCSITSTVSLGNKNENTIDQAQKSLVKNVVWKMMQIEMKQKYAGADFGVKEIDVALNHGQVIVLFNCLLLKENKVVSIQVVDMFN